MFSHWHLTGLSLHCHIQTTVGRQTPTMWVLATFLCWGVPELTLTPMWPGAEGRGTTWCCPAEWKSGTGYCGSCLCRCLIMDPTPVRKGMDAPVCLNVLYCIWSWLHNKLKAALWSAERCFIIFGPHHGQLNSCFLEAVVSGFVMLCCGVNSSIWQMEPNSSPKSNFFRSRLSNISISSHPGYCSILVLNNLLFRTISFSQYLINCTQA